MDRSIEDLLPFAQSTGQKARFPGDRGRGADMSLDALPKPSNVISPGVAMPGLEIDRPGPLMPMVPSAPGGPSVQRISSGAPVWNPQEFPNIPPPPGSSPLAPPPPPVAGASPASPPYRPWVSAAGRALGPLGSAIGKADEAVTGAVGALPKIPAAPLALAMPWIGGAGAAAMGGRALLSGGVGALEGIKQGESPGEIGTRAAVGGVLSPVGDVAAKGLRYVGSAIPHKLFSGKSAGELGNWLRQNVPAWKNEKSIYEMARGLGSQAKLGDAYEKALTAAASKIPAGTTVTLPADVAKRAGFAGAKDAVDVAVDARRLMEALPNLKKRMPDLRHEVLDALHAGLPPGSVPDKAFKEYAFGKGWMDYAKKSGLFDKGKNYDASLAQEGLRQYGPETLGRRGMTEVGRIIEGPLAQHIKKETGRGTGTLIGGALGAFGGGQALGGGLGAAGGATGGGIAGGFLGQRLPLYRNVPETLPQIGQIRRSLLQALTQQMLQNQRSTGQ